jgi:hypothetical protein
MLFVTAVPAAGGFAIVTSPWPSWRNLGGSRVAWVSVLGGVVAYFVQLTGLAGILLLIPVPAGFGALGAALRLLFPGIAVGLLALVGAWLLGRATAPRPLPAKTR